MAVSTKTHEREQPPRFSDLAFWGPFRDIYDTQARGSLAYMFWGYLARVHNHPMSPPKVRNELVFL